MKFKSNNHQLNYANFPETVQVDLRGHGPSNRRDVIDIFWIGSLQLIYGKLDERSVSRDPGNGGAVVA